MSDEKAGTDDGVAVGGGAGRFCAVLLQALQYRSFTVSPHCHCCHCCLPSPCREQREREAELREFDELLRRREAFKQKGPPYS